MAVNVGSVATLKLLCPFNPVMAARDTAVFVLSVLELWGFLSCLEKGLGDHQTICLLLKLSL